MSAMPLDLEALGAPSVPAGVLKYEHLRSRIAAAIDSGAWVAGAQLPPEVEIASATRLSLGTVQRALKELAVQGYVVRQHGSGTFVADRGREMAQPLHCRYVPDSGEAVLPVYTHLVQRRHVAEPEPWTSVLGTDSKGAVLIDRTLNVDGRFRVASRVYMHASRFGSLLDMPADAFDGVNLKKLLAVDFKVPVRRVQQRLRLETPDPDLRNWIGEREAPMVLAIRATGFAADGHLVYYQLLWAPPCDEELIVSSLVE